MLVLLFFLPALWSAETSLEERTTGELLERLKQISIEQQGLSPGLQLSLENYERQSKDLNLKQESLQSSYETLSLGLSNLEKTLISLEDRLTNLEEPQIRLQTTLENTTSSVQSLQQSWKSYSEEQERQISSLRKQNMFLWILTGLTASLAVTALLIN